MKTQIYKTKNINKEINSIRIIDISDDKRYNIKNLVNQPNSNLITLNNSKLENSNRSLNKNDKNNFNNELDKDELNKNLKDEQKLVKELKEKNNSDFYIFYVIKNIVQAKRRKYLSESEIESLSYKNALEI